MKKKTFQAVARNISYLTQLGFSIAFPIVVFLFLGLWLRPRLGGWVMAAALILGLGTAASSFLQFIRHALRESERGRDE